MKKIISSVISILLLFSSVFAMPFVDVDKNSEVGKAVEKLWEKGYVNGYDGVNFAPQNNLTRAEFVKMVNKVFFYDKTGSNPFIDVKAEDWFYNDVTIAYQAGYISGMGNGIFCPGENVTREQMCVILDNILKLAELPYSGTVTDEISDWARASVYKALSLGYISAEDGGKLRATQAATRGEAALMLSKCVIDEPDISQIQPIDLSTIADDVLQERMTEIINTLNEKVLPLCYLDEQRGVVNSIAKSMGEYLKDRSYDYKAAEKETYEIYASMENRNDRLALQAMITENISINDLVIVFDFFFPEGSGEL